ncbi:MAG TPA: PH domain-containing protein [Jatrophihabitantaceae bacterium]|nr:PH domain-containing protein [Jatrophihabitantaceae bacterium]
MPYPDKVLAGDEEVVEHLHPHWITLVPAALWFLVVCAAAGLCIGYAPDGKPWHLVVIVLVLVVAIVVVIWRSLVPLLERQTTHYVFTTHRVLIRRGVLRRTGRDIALQRISDVGFEQSLWDRIVKAGTVTIESAGEQGQERLVNVPRSEQQQQQLNRLIEQDSARRAREAQGHSSTPTPPATPPLPPGYPPPPATPPLAGGPPFQQYSQPYPPAQ